MKLIKRNLILSLILGSGILFSLSSYLSYAQNFGDIVKMAKDNKSLDKKEEKAEKKLSDYDKIITKEAKTAKGFIDLHLVKDRLYLELPVKLLDKAMLFSGRVSKISNNKDVIAGQMATSPIMVAWSKDDSKLYLHKVSTKTLADKSSSIYERVMDNAMQPILSAFKIEAWNKDSSAVVINATNLFLTNESPISPFLPASPFDALFGLKKLNGVFKRDLSSIINISSYPSNLNVGIRAVYSVNKEPFTAVINASLLLLPDKAMQGRIADDRLGFFTDQSTIISTNQMNLEKVRYVNRFRLEPKAEDIAKMKAGKLVEPQKPIIYYVDSAFPDEWWPYIKEGIEDWQKAFEKAGFKNAIIAKKYPKDPDFNPYDARFNCIIYSSSKTANAMGPSWTDPRSGEILQSSVYFYHNVLDLLHSWRFVQTAAADPKARSLNYDIKVLGPMLRYLFGHEVGHTLGLMHNMGASHAYAVEDLRKASFTKKWGTTPSIMDYARYNYVAQPNDGVRYFLPPRLGVYDIFAIQWAYTPIFSAKNPQEEVSTLNKWIEDKADDPRYTYGPQQILVVEDPYSQTEDLGDDAMLASSYGINNLKITTKNLFKWTEQEGKTYDRQKELFEAIQAQFKRYLSHCIAYIGGIHKNIIVQGDNKNAVQPISKEKQKEALFFVLNQALEESQWILTDEVREKLAISENDISGYMLNLMNIILSNGTIGRISKSYSLSNNTTYSIKEFMDDLDAFVWKNTAKLSTAERNMQFAYVTNLINILDLKADDAKKSKLSSAKIEAKAVLFEKLIKAKAICEKNKEGEEMGHYANLAFLINEALD